ncbi:PREDICTED: uncharacterized protein LOC104578817 [Tinamus guttatus]|nr:PREDICTED: uncharacterized protein LOC104578817 [Tinamus guttatus]
MGAAPKGRPVPSAGLNWEWGCNRASPPAPPVPAALLGVFAGRCGELAPCEPPCEAPGCAGWGPACPARSPCLLPQTIQIMTGFMHIGFGVVLTMLTSVYTSFFIIGEIPFLGGVSFIISGCLSIGAEKSPTECAVKGSQTMNVISAIFALLGIVAFIIDLNLNGLYRSSFDSYNHIIVCHRHSRPGWELKGLSVSSHGVLLTGASPGPELAGNGISIVLLIFTVLEFCIAVATAHFWCRATRVRPNEGLQVLLGLLHFGVGGILVSFIRKPVEMLTMESWYLFWGGLLFISSGSCSMAAEKNQSSYLMKGCMALNITSVLATMVGIILVLWDLNICNELCYGPALQLELRVTRGLLGILLMFTLLETCITLACTYLGWQTQLVTSMQAADFMANVVPPPVLVLPPPPAYDEIFMNTDRRATGAPLCPCEPSLHLGVELHRPGRALQILIGVACLGFGGVASIISQPSLIYWTLTVATGYPFWSGLMFVTSGSLSVAVEYADKPILVKSSLGTNIVSAMFAGTGTILSVAELAGNKRYQFSSLQLSKAGNGIAGVMLFLSTLELCIAVLLSYQGYRAAQHLRQPALHIVAGIIRFCCGIFLTMAEHHIPLSAVARGLLFWLGVLLLVTGSLLVESGKRENILLEAKCLHHDLQ